MTQSKAQERLKRLLAQRRALIGATVSSVPDSPTTNSSSSIPGLQPDPYQDRAVELAVARQSYVLTGPAGSGKSTTLRRIVSALQASDKLSPLSIINHKYLRTGSPGIVITSFTNRAVENDKNILGSEYASNCLTIHKLLEYRPVYYADPDTGKTKTTFEPKRNATNPLPPSLQVLVIEEATLTNVPLWNMLFEALPTGIQIIFVGDIQQLPPVFGKPIFIHAMQQELPVVELKNIYRQALESPILSLAHRILSGKIIPAKELPDWNRQSESTGSKLQVRTWPKPITETQALIVLQTWLPNQIDTQKYDPSVDMILTPFGKSGRFGAVEINKIVAWHLAQSQGKEVWEVYTGINKKYFAIGDRVICNKQEGVVKDIKHNRSYYGQAPRPASKYMDYNGITHEGYMAEDTSGDLNSELEDIDKLFEALNSHAEDGESLSRQASHIIIVQSTEDPEIEYTLNTAGELNDLQLGYAMTVHKAQGSEWPRVLFFVHACHAIAVYRELLYTAITRAREELVIVCESNTLIKGIVSQRLPGTTLNEKLGAFDKYLEKQRNLGGGNQSEIPNGLRTLLETNRTRD